MRMLDWTLATYTPQAGLPAAVIALLADPSEQCRVAALQLLSSNLPPEWAPLDLLILAIAARFGCSVSSGSDNSLPADSSEEVRLAAVNLLTSRLMAASDGGCIGLPIEQLHLASRGRTDRPHSTISAEEVQSIVVTVQRAMGDTWVDVRKV
jgi:hypothetical protein